MITKTQSDVLWELVCKYEKAIQDSTRNEGCKFFEGRQDYACELLFNFVTGITAATSNESSDDGWIEWSGGKRPVDSTTLITVRLRNGEEHLSPVKHHYEWRHFNRWNDIVAYRVVEG